MLDHPIAQIKGLRVEFETKDGPVVGVENVSFDIASGETLCIVGESGSGKSVSSLSLMRLVEYGGGTIAAGELLFDPGDDTPVDLAKAEGNLMRQILQFSSILLLSSMAAWGTSPENSSTRRSISLLERSGPANRSTRSKR